MEKPTISDIFFPVALPQARVAKDVDCWEVVLEGGREGGREEGREGGRKGGREGGREKGGEKGGELMMRYILVPSLYHPHARLHGYHAPPLVP